MAGWRSTRSASYCLRLLGLIWGQLTHELCQPWLIHLVHGLASSHLTLDCRQEVHAPAIFSLLRLEPQAGAGGMCGVMVVRSAESVVVRWAMNKGTKFGTYSPFPVPRGDSLKSER